LKPLTLITGGAGFIGTNVADCVLRGGGRVRILDDLSRPGVDRNLIWLRSRWGDHRLDVQIGDVCDATVIRRAVAGASDVFHFAAQVAVTTSLDDPFHDFRVNVEGTVRLLDELRRLPRPPFVLFTSTNKVYGALPDVALERAGDRGLRLLLVRLTLLVDELHADHRAKTADLRDARLLRDRAQLFDDDLADRLGALRETLLFDDVQRREPRHARDGVPAEGRPMRARLPLLVQPPRRDECAKREPATERLRERDRVGHDARAVRGEHRAGPAEARLHLVEDEQDVVALRDRAKAL
jgi:hypothetical protein